MNFLRSSKGERDGSKFGDEYKHGLTVKVGAVAPRARVLAGLEHHLVEHLAVPLAERAAVVHPVVDDRLRVEAVRRHGATHAVSPAEGGFGGL